MAEFNPIKALSEQIAGISNILTTLSAETRSAEMKAAEATQHYDSLVKLEAYTKGELALKRQALYKLQTKADKPSG